MNKVLYGIVFLTVFSCGKAPAQKPDIKMHRIQDTTRDESGWYYAKSTEGNFSANLPLPFNDFTLTVNDSIVGVVKTYTIGSKTQEGIKFSITEMPYTSKTLEPNFENLIQGFKKSGNIVAEVNKEEQEGYSAIFFLVTNKESGAYVKYIKTNKSMITMIIEFPLGHKNIVEQYSKSFFASLKIRG